MSGRRALLILNRNSSRADHFADRAIAALRAGGLELEEPEVSDPAKLPALVRERAAEFDMVIVGGGDGAMNFLSGALHDVDRPVGLLPMGTANDLARTLAIPVDPEAAAAIIVAGHSRPVDVGVVNDHWFFNVASIGLSVEVTNRQTKERKKRLKLLSYALSVYEATRALRRFSVTIEVDGVAHHLKAVQVAVGNGRHYGGGMTVAETAEIDDGTLDVYAITANRFIDLLLLAPRFRTGRFADADHVRSFTGERVKLITKRPMTVNTDGELTVKTPAEFHVARGAVILFAPKT